MRPEDPTIAELLKPLGYATAQFGKNHLGDRDEHLPTMHGFDEFFGNLYHLNAEEEPELPDYPSPNDFPDFRKNFGPRGVLHCWANPDGSRRWRSCARGSAAPERVRRTGARQGQPSSKRPLQLSSMPLPQISAAPGWMVGSSSRQSMHQTTPSPSWSGPVPLARQASQLET